MRKSIDNNMKLELNRIMHGRKGLALKFDDYLISSDLSDTAKLLYSGLYFMVPSKHRKSNLSKNKNVLNFKSKIETYQTLEISRSQFYRAINELEEKGLVITQSLPTGVTYYELTHNLDKDTQKTSAAFITTDMLQNKYVTTSQNRHKVYSAKARIVLGRLTRLSQQKATRKIETTAKNIGSSFGLKKSTVYYLLKKFSETGTVATNKNQPCIYTLVLLDHYISEQRINNENLIALRNEQLANLNRKHTDEEKMAIDFIYGII